MPVRAVADGAYAVTDPFEASEDNFQTQASIQFAALPSGGFIAVWTDTDGFNDPGIRAQFYDKLGRKVGNEFAVNSVTEGTQSGSSAVALTNGDVAIFWASDGPDANGFDIIWQKFDSTGQPIGTELKVNTTRLGFQTDPKAVSLADGSFVVMWQSGSSNVAFQMFNASGNKVGTETIVDETYARTADIAALDGGGFAVVWHDWENSDIRAKIFDAGGEQVGEEFTVNSFQDGVQDTPSVAGLPGGGFVVVWQDNGKVGSSDTGHHGVWMQFFDASGGQVGDEIMVNSLLPSKGGSPTVETVGDDEILVVWRDSSSTDSHNIGYLRAQFFDFTGARVGEEFSVTTELEPGENFGQRAPDIGVLSSGNIVLGWGDDDVRAEMILTALSGSASNDTLVATGETSAIAGYGGDDLIKGGPDNEWLDGGDGSDTVNGGDGNDILDGGSDPDLLRGQNGDDELHGGHGGDELNGGAGNDLIHGDTGSDTLRGQAGDDNLFGGLGHDDLFGGTENDFLYGEGGNDRVYGNGGDDFVNGGVGNDNVFGGAGNDEVYGGNGQDIMNGHAGNDLIVGGPGSDLIVGGQGADRFLFNEGHLGSGPSATDRIKDFSSAQGDVIDLGNIDADTTTAGDQAFEWIGNAAFSGSAGELRTEIVGNTTYVYGDTNGDGNADIALLFTGQVTLAEGDFIL